MPHAEIGRLQFHDSLSPQIVQGAQPTVATDEQQVAPAKRPLGGRDENGSQVDAVPLGGKAERIDHRKVDFTGVNRAGQARGIVKQSRGDRDAETPRPAHGFAEHPDRCLNIVAVGLEESRRREADQHRGRHQIPRGNVARRGGEHPAQQQRGGDEPPRGGRTRQKGNRRAHGTSSFCSRGLEFQIASMVARRGA